MLFADCHGTVHHSVTGNISELTYDDDDDDDDDKHHKNACTRPHTTLHYQNSVEQLNIHHHHHKKSQFSMKVFRKVKGFVGQLEMPSSSSMPHGFTCLGYSGWNPDGFERHLRNWVSVMFPRVFQWSWFSGKWPKIWRLNLTPLGKGTQVPLNHDYGRK